MGNLHKHYWHYFIYALIFGCGLLSIVFAVGKSDIQAMLLMLTVFAYFLWAMVHHYVHHQLHVRVVVEYILIMVLGTVLMLFLFGV